MTLSYDFTVGTAYFKYIDISTINGAFRIVNTETVGIDPDECGGSGTCLVTIEAISGGPDHGFFTVRQGEDCYNLGSGSLTDQYKVNIERR